MFGGRLDTRPSHLPLLSHTKYLLKVPTDQQGTVKLPMRTGSRRQPSCTHGAEAWDTLAHRPGASTTSHIVRLFSTSLYLFLGLGSRAPSASCSELVSMMTLSLSHLLGRATRPTPARATSILNDGSHEKHVGGARDVGRSPIESREMHAQSCFSA